MAAPAKNPEVSLADIKYWLDYDSKKGVFTARVKRPNIKGVGYLVGWTDDRGYVRLFLNRKLFLAHRLAWFWVYGCWPKEEIDHINGIRNDNRIVNLREASSIQNCYSKKPHRDSLSAYKGVTKAKRRGVWRGRWQAQIGIAKKMVHLGYYRSPIAAAKAYDTAAEKHFGKFAKTNKELGLL